jgi:hypothetical protein
VYEYCREGLTRLGRTSRVLVLMTDDKPAVGIPTSSPTVQVAAISLVRDRNPFGKLTLAPIDPPTLTE